MARKFWWPRRLVDQQMIVRNFRSKIAGHAAVLGLSPAETAAAVALCDTMITAYNATEACKLTMQAMTAWRDEVLFGKQTGAVAPAAPLFPAPPAGGLTRGAVDQFIELRNQIVAAPGFNESIGDDLGLLGPEHRRKDASEIVPELNFRVANGGWIKVTGSLQGTDAVRIEKKAGDGEFTTAAFLTITPGEFPLTTTTPGAVERVALRAIFIRKNKEYGNFSPIYNVVVDSAV